MKIKQGFVLRKIGDSWMVVPIGNMVERIHGLISLNETAADIWNLLQTERSKEELVKELLEEYDAESELLEKEVEKFLDMLNDKGLLDL